MNEPLDVRSLKCPLPAMLARRALEKCKPGSVLTVLADDPMAALDIPHMCHAEGHAYDGMTPHGRYNEFRITCRPALAPLPDRSG